MWPSCRDTKSLNQSLFLNTTPRITTTWQLTSLWEAGNHYIASATELWANGIERNRTYGDFWDW